MPQRRTILPVVVALLLLAPSCGERSWEDSLPDGVRDAAIEHGRASLAEKAAGLRYAGYAFRPMVEGETREGAAKRRGSVEGRKPTWEEIEALGTSMLPTPEEPDLRRARERAVERLAKALESLALHAVAYDEDLEQLQAWGLIQAKREAGQ